VRSPTWGIQPFPTEPKPCKHHSAWSPQRLASVPVHRERLKPSNSNPSGPLRRSTSRATKGQGCNWRRGRPSPLRSIDVTRSASRPEPRAPPHLRKWGTRAIAPAL
jgi:hypothetical protein